MGHVIKILRETHRIFNNTSTYVIYNLELYVDSHSKLKCSFLKLRNRGYLRWFKRTEGGYKACNGGRVVEGMVEGEKRGRSGVYPPL